MPEEIRRKLLARECLRQIEDLFYVMKHGCAPPIDWRGPDDEAKPVQPQPAHA